MIKTEQFIYGIKGISFPKTNVYYNFKPAIYMYILSFKLIRIVKWFCLLNWQLIGDNYYTILKPINYLTLDFNIRPSSLHTSATSKKHNAFLKKSRGTAKKYMGFFALFYQVPLLLICRLPIWNNPTKINHMEQSWYFAEAILSFLYAQYSDLVES
jgi:hypothetical protein